MKISPWSRMFSASQYFFMIKKVFHKQKFSQIRNFSTSKIIFYKIRFFLDQRSSPIRNFSTSQNFSLIKKFFHKQKSFPQANIFPWSRKLSTKIFPSPGFLDQEILPTRKFCTNQNLSSTKKFFNKQKPFSQAKIFPWSRKFFPQAKRFQTNVSVQ